MKIIVFWARVIIILIRLGSSQYPIFPSATRTATRMMISSLGLTAVHSWDPASIGRSASARDLLMKWKLTRQNASNPPSPVPRAPVGVLLPAAGSQILLNTCYNRTHTHLSTAPQILSSSTCGPPSSAFLFGRRRERDLFGGRSFRLFLARPRGRHR
jgi:hypothetical protein